MTFSQPHIRNPLHTFKACATMLLGILCWLATPEAAYAEEHSTQPAIAFAARVVGDQHRARLIVDFDKPVDRKIYLLNDPMRIVVDLSKTVFSLDGEAKQLPKSLVSAFRFGSVSPTRSRIVLELAKPVALERQAFRHVESESRHRLILDMVGSDEEAFKKAALPKAPQIASETPRASPVAASKKPNTFTIVIDPGHGGIDGGATGRGGTEEKTVTLNFAKILREHLTKEQQFHVVMTRDGDTFVSLRDRVKIAREAKADLLISLHADSLRQNNIRGATVYTLSEEGSDDVSRMLARKENRADLAAGLSIPVKKPAITDILIELTRRETKLFSHRVADLIVSRMQGDIKLIRNPHRSADFFVLKAPEIPSVLLEMGYLSNAKDEKLLTTQEWQNRAALRMKEAVVAFFKPKLAGQ